MVGVNAWLVLTIHDEIFCMITYPKAPSPGVAGQSAYHVEAWLGEERTRVPGGGGPRGVNNRLHGAACSASSQ